MLPPPMGRDKTTFQFDGAGDESAVLLDTGAAANLARSKCHRHRNTIPERLGFPIAKPPPMRAPDSNLGMASRKEYDHGWTVLLGLR